ncbi:hypothetical protein VNI00_018228 [Paramarasmius palmivorus]|uniref:FAD-binding domain-containing protein n=1 Tax=Paramarasmius palmivorus TaxID=297713 RepID=A0AAW0B155_9AGAR
MPTQPDVLIAGAGPSGLVLALLLCRNGLSVRIIDKSGDFKVGQRGSGIHARTLELYKILGILTEVEKHLRKFPPMVIYIPGQDEPINRGPLVEELPLEPQYLRINYEVLSQEEHQDILRQILQKEYGCIVETSTELETFTQDDNGVSVKIGKEGKQETARVKWLVGADGARSTVRKQLGLTFLGDSNADISPVMGDIEVEDFGQVDSTKWSMFGNQDDKLAFLTPYTKNGKNMMSFGLGGAQLNEEQVLKSEENLVNAFYEIIGNRGLVLGPLYTTPSIWRPNIRMTNKFHEGRVFIIGDAGHVHSFTGGQVRKDQVKALYQQLMCNVCLMQGMNSSIQDSFNLAWKLALVEKGLSPRSLVDSYTTERLPLIAAMLDLTTKIFKKDISKSSALGPSQRGFEIRQLGITYRGTSSILVDERYPNTVPEEVDPYRSGLDGTVHAGDRAPEAPGLKCLGGDDTTSIYDFFDVTSHTVLLFGKSVSDVQGSLDLVVKYPKNLMKTLLVLPQGSDWESQSSSLDQVLIDAEGHAYTNYRTQPGDNLTVVVRPDGVRIQAFNT